MRLSEEQRRFLRRVYIFLPLVAAIGIMVFDAMTPRAISWNNGHVSKPADEHGPNETT